MMLRLVLLAVVVATALLIVAVVERRRGAGRVAGLSSGVTVVTGPGCGLCGPTVSTLRGRGVPVRVVDVSELMAGTVLSLPTVFVVDEKGSVVLRRSGRSALTDSAALAQAAGQG